MFAPEPPPSPERPAAVSEHFVVGPSFTTKGAALEDDPCAPLVVVAHRPTRAAISRPLEHDSRTADVGRGAAAAALESAPDAR